MEKPVIELKSIKHSELASHETHCYSATVYVDGKRFAKVSNDGHGGCDHVDVVGGNHEDLIILNDRIAATYPKIHVEGIAPIEKNLEIICSDLVNDFLTLRPFKNQLKKKILGFHNQEKQIYSWKLPPLDDNLNRLREIKPEYTFLNGLDDATVLSLIRQSMQV